MSRRPVDPRELEAVIVERGPLPARELARTVRRRYEAVLDVLHADPRFVWTGKRRASRFDLASTVRSFDAGEASERWGCSTETATEILFGAEGFLERGLVSTLNGNGRVVVTDAGLAMAGVVGALDPGVTT
jgi:hypothetical protein